MKKEMAEQRSEQLKILLDEALDAIYIGNLNTVDSDLMLPDEAPGGIVITWFSSDERFIHADGAVHRPLFGMGNRRVTLTAEAALSGIRSQRHFSATVLQEAKAIVIREMLPVKMTAEPGALVRLPSVVIVSCDDGRLTTLPVLWPLGNADDPGVFPVPDAEGEYTYTGTLQGKAEFSDENVRGPLTVIRVVDPREDARRKGERWSEELQGPMYMPARESGPARQLQYFSIREIRLLPDSDYEMAQRRMNAWLLARDEGQMLYAFRRACGLSTEGARPMTGWDAEDCRLKGHTTGHYLSGLALAYAATGDVRFQKKIRRLTEGLAACQDAFAASKKTAPGFLSAYSEEQFDLLERFTPYPEIWAPYYTLDKIMSGLYDCYILADCGQAMEILQKMGDWVYRRLARLSKQQLDRMWSMYIAGEFGGMIGTMVRLYRLSGQADHLLAAQMFSNEKLFYPMELGVDTLEDMHANQHIPQIIGAMEMYETTGDSRYWKIAWNFWRIVTEGHVYGNGGVGETEMFHAAHALKKYLTEKTAESCASYNMLRLTGLLFPYRPEGHLLDYYENTLLNHILVSASHKADGGTTYFLPLCPGGRKEYSTEENTCCHGTGMESRYRFMEHIYAWDEEVVYVNLLIPSVLESEGVHLVTEAGEDGVISIQTLLNLPKDLRIHIPQIMTEVLEAEAEERIRVGGLPVPGCRIRNGFLEIPGGFVAGDRVTIHLPMRLAVVKDSEAAGLAHLTFGLHILAEISEDSSCRELPDPAALSQKEDMSFTCGERKLVPFSRIDRENYHVYFRYQADQGGINERLP